MNSLFRMMNSITQIADYYNLVAKDIILVNTKQSNFQKLYVTPLLFSPAIISSFFLHS